MFTIWYYICHAQRLHKVSFRGLLLKLFKELFLIYNYSTQYVDKV